MSVAADRCSACRGLVDLEDLFCANCGREVEGHAPADSGRVARGARGFECKNCGASMSYDATAGALKCPFCGSTDVAEDGSKGVLAPEFVVPFAIDQAGADRAFRAWLGSGFWRPSDLGASAVLDELRAVFVPFWIFSARVETHWTADSGRTPPGAMAAWFPVAGSGVVEVDNIWVPASEGISARELVAVGPFDADRAVPPDRVDLDGRTVEQFSVSRRYARPLALERIEEAETGRVAAELGGSVRNIKVNCLLLDATGRPALVPVYVLAYRYRDRLYRFVLNGQTGASVGQAPTSVAKVVGAIVLVVGLVAAGLALILR